ncbi:unnamed protein product [Larinioides sclopetarius]|uniref:Uncharacterized protein n=1 Tax=Larinioides sclopetarius TaxID=280406 RepID=A0AAV1YRX7_9ARAC
MQVDLPRLISDRSFKHVDEKRREGSICIRPAAWLRYLPTFRPLKLILTREPSYQQTTNTSSTTQQSCSCSISGIVISSTQNPLTVFLLFFFQKVLWLGKEAAAVQH